MSTRQTPPGSIDYQLTDLDEARRVLDLLPDGIVAARQLPDFWTLRRRTPAPMDRTLTAAAMDWVMELPSEVRPVRLCQRFPRLGNALAHAWATRDHCESLLAALLTDRRGKRRGFASEVRLELERLGAYRATIR